jgi:hypothetical protein
MELMQMYHGTLFKNGLYTFYVNLRAIKKRNSMINSVIRTCILLCIIFTTTMQAISIQQVSLSTFKKQNPMVKTIQCTDHYPFNMTQCPLYPDLAAKIYPSVGYFQDMYIIQVPNGIAHVNNSWFNYLYINNCFITETMHRDHHFNNGQAIKNVPKPIHTIKIPGRVAVIYFISASCYGHWILDILCQLALLEMHNIEYDYLYVPYYKKYMQETLDLWGIDRSKIIPACFGHSIQADTIIMTTNISATEHCYPHSNYSADFLIHYTRGKLLAAVEKQKDILPTSEKIFISRKDAGGRRAVLDEDEIFAPFKAKGFKRYELSSLSVAQQISLFHNAKQVISFTGSGCTNVIFCKPQTKVIEIMQASIDATFFYLADMCRLKHYFIDTSILDDLSVNLSTGSCDRLPRLIPQAVIEKFLQEHPEI